jgi:tetratricopeptide (TPR) repeat protein
MINKVVLIFSLVLLCDNENLYSQTLRETLQKADSLFAKKEYGNSIKKYKRAIYFSKGEYGIYKKTADAYYTQKKYEFACNYYDSSLFENRDTNYEEIIFCKTDCYIFMNQYDSALNCLNRLNPEKSNNLKKKINFYKGIISFSTYDYDEAETFFIISLSDTAFQAKDDIKTLFMKKRLFKNPEHMSAGIMSLIVPGTGQFYSGHVKSGINSLVLIGIISVIAIDMGMRFCFIDPFISILPWFIRYYRGGYLNAKDFASEKLNLKRSETLNEIIRILNSDDKY